MKRIVLFSSLYMPHLGGVEKYTQSLARALSADFEVHVFCLNTEKQPAFRREGSVSIHSLPCIRLFSGRLPLPQPSGLRIVRQFFTAHKVDRAIIQTRLYPFNLWIAGFLAHAKIPFFLIEHGTGYVQFRSPILSAIWRGYERWMAHRFMQIGCPFYGVSQAAADWLREFNIEAKGVIPNGIDPTEIRADILPTLAEKEYIRIAFAGRILKEKGILELLKAFEKTDGAKLTIIGDGEMNLLSQAHLQANIEITGKVDHGTLLAILRESNIFCFPTAYPEGLPTVVLEAGALGLPVVSTPMGGLKELIIDNETGLLVPVGDVDAIADALNRLIHDAPLRKKLGENLQTHIFSRYTWDRIAAKVSEILF